MGGVEYYLQMHSPKQLPCKKKIVYSMGGVEYYLQMHSQKKIAATQLLVKNRAKPLKERRFCVQRHI